MDEHERSYMRARQSAPLARRHLFHGRWMTAQEIAHETGLKVRTVHRRIQFGLPIDAPPKFGPSPRLFEFRGRLATIRDMMAETGLSRSQVSKRTDGIRFFERWELTDPYAELRSDARVLTMGGTRDSVSGWARRTGIPRYVISGRLKIGWPVSRALTTPVQDHGACGRRNRRVLDRITSTIRRRRNAEIIARMLNAIHATGGRSPTSPSRARTGACSSNFHCEGASS